MSDKKQSSIEWLFEQVWINPVSKLPEILEQAKEMHQNEIMNAFYDAQKAERFNDHISPKEYYEQTFGGNNEII